MARYPTGTRPPRRVVTGQDEFGNDIVETATQANAQRQSQEREETLLSKQSEVQTFIDPVTGQDSREFDRNGNPVEGSGTLDKRTVSGPINYKPSAPANPIAAPFKPLVRPDSTMNAAKLVDLKGAGIKTMSDILSRGVDEVEGSSYLRNPDGSRTLLPSDFRDQYAADAEATTLATEKANADQAAKDSLDQERLGQQGNPLAKADGTQRPMTSGDAATQLMIGAIPPEFGYLGPVIQGLLGGTDKAVAGEAGLVASSLKSAASSYKKRGTVLGELKADLEGANEDMEEVLDTARDINLTQLQKSEDAERERLQWQEDREVRDIKRRQRADIEGRVTELGFKGGFGSGNGVNAIREADQAWEEAIDLVRDEAGFHRRDLAVKFSGLRTQVQMGYMQGMQEQLQGYRQERSSLALQELGNEELKADKEKEALERLVTNVNGLQLQKAKDVMGIADKIHGLIGEQRAEKSAKKDKLWSRLFTQRSQDGNLNPSMTRQILGEMQAAGVDVSGIDANAMTLEQVNELHREQKAAETAKKGAQVSPGDSGRVSDFDSAMSQLSKLKADLQGETFTTVFGTDATGGFVDRVIGLAPGSQRKKAQASIDRVKQVIGKALEGGVLRKEDEEKYKKILPTIADSPGIIEFKIKELEHDLEIRRQQFIDNLRRSGYDVSGFDVGDPLDDREVSPLTNDEADNVLKQLDSGEPLSQETPTGFLKALAYAHQQHEGYGTPNAKTITAGNNPGALRWHPGQAKYGGKKGPKNFTVFPSYEQGYSALVADLRAKLTGGSAHIDYANNPTLLDYVKVYAPTDDGNDPSGYARALVTKLRKQGFDVSVNTPLSDLSSFLS